MVDERVGFAFGVLSFGALAVAGLHPRFIEVLFKSAGLGFAHSFIEAAMQERIVALGLLAHAFHVFEQFGHLFLLFLNLTRDISALQHLFQ